MLACTVQCGSKRSAHGVDGMLKLEMSGLDRLVSLEVCPNELSAGHTRDRHDYVRCNWVADWQTLLKSSAYVIAERIHALLLQVSRMHVVLMLNVSIECEISIEPLISSADIRPSLVAALGVEPSLSGQDPACLRHVILVVQLRHLVTLWWCALFIDGCTDAYGVSASFLHGVVLL